MRETHGGRDLRVFAVLFGILAISNLLKPFQLVGDQTGFVFFGHRLTGTPNAIAGPLFGLFLLVYAVGIWRRRRYAVPMGWLYAAYVVTNLVMFQAIATQPPGVGYKLFGLVYAVIAIGVSGGAAYLLSQEREQLA